MNGQPYQASFASDDYELVDFGAGRKLERFGSYLLDRPSPAATNAPGQPRLWSQAAARYDRSGPAGKWTGAEKIEVPWTVGFGPLKLELKLTEAGHLGVFPEQAVNWQWIADCVRSTAARKVLNLFAYTGASTLAAAAAGAEVVHVDAAEGTVAWARRNARASGLDHLPIRWIVEDGPTFARREARRGNTYDAVILDPPAYGHGPKGQSWKIDQDLEALLACCASLCPEAKMMLLTCHSGKLARASELLPYAELQWSNLRSGGKVGGDELCLVSSAGVRLHCGAAVRWCRSTG